jgi:predicted metal-dependent phosphoesterase TrpH
MDGERGLLLCELHAHTTWSDGFLSPRELVDLYGGLGFDVLCVTDHVVPTWDPWRSVASATFDAYLEELEAEAERARRRYDLLLIPGLELTYSNADPDRAGHALALGLREPVAMDEGLVPAIRSARKAGAAIVAAHPNGPEQHPASRGTQFFWRRWAELDGLVDCYELFNRRQVFSWVADAGLPAVATGDFHGLENLAGWKTMLQCVKEERAVLDCLRSSARAYLLPWGRDLALQRAAA